MGVNAGLVRIEPTGRVSCLLPSKGQDLTQELLSFEDCLSVTGFVLGSRMIWHYLVWPKRVCGSKRGV